MQPFDSVSRHQNVCDIFVALIFFPLNKISKDNKKLSLIQASIQTCASVCRGAVFSISSVRSAQSSSLGRRRPDSGPSGRRPGFVRPRCLRSAAFFSCICWIKWWRLASVASKKDFLSPAVVALPVEKKKRKTGAWNWAVAYACGGVFVYVFF